MIKDYERVRFHPEQWTYPTFILYLKPAMNSHVLLYLNTHCEHANTTLMRQRRNISKRHVQISNARHVLHIKILPWSGQSDLIFSAQPAKKIISGENKSCRTKAIAWLTVNDTRQFVLEEVLGSGWRRGGGGGGGGTLKDPIGQVLEGQNTWQRAKHAKPYSDQLKA